MKRIRIVQAALFLSTVVLITSCGSGRDYRGRPYPPPRSQTNFSLIIGPSSGLIITRSPNGMYYYRDPRGFIYWRGYDNRYYLDRRYMSRSYYGHNQYNDWRRYHNYRHHRR
jgi:hypothetical protein